MRPLCLDAVLVPGGAFGGRAAVLYVEQSPRKRTKLEMLNCNFNLKAASLSGADGHSCLSWPPLACRQRY